MKSVNKYENKNLNVIIRKPKIEINNENYKYLQLFDLIENKDNIGIEVDNPDEIIYNFIEENHKEQTCFTAICSAGSFIYRITYLSNEKRVVFTRIEIPSTRLVKYEKEEDSIAVAIGDEKEEEISTLPFG